MTEYNEGDLVEAIKGDSFMRARLIEVHGLLVLEALGGTIQWYEKNGWTTAVIETAPPKVVLPKATVMFNGGFVATWWDESLSWSITGADRAWGDPDEILRHFGSDFTILEPVPETAKKVLDRVRAYLMSSVSLSALNDLRREFGATK